MKLKRKYLLLLMLLTFTCGFFMLFRLCGISIDGETEHITTVIFRQVALSAVSGIIISTGLALVFNWQTVGPYFQKLNRFRAFLYQLVRRDFKAKYKRSFLGIIWTVLNPLLTMIVLTIVFSALFRFNIDNFPVYLLSGQVLFTFYSEATTMSMSSILGGSAMIKKVNVPKYVFPLSRTISSLVNFALSMIALLLVMVITGSHFYWTLIFVPISVLYTFVFSLGIGMLLSALTVFFRDITYLYSIFMTAVTYFTPLFYPIDIIPEKFRIILSLNPLYHLVAYFRTVVLYGGIPTLWQNVVCALVSIVALIVGVYAFYRKQDDFILYI